MHDRSEPRLADLLDAFCGRDETRAGRAFEELAALTRRGLHGFLRGRLHSEEAREDVIEEALKRIWVRRHSLQNQGPTAWWSLVRMVSEQCRIDLVRKIGPEVAWDESETADLPDEELASTSSLLELAEERDELYRAADELWLGFDPDLSDRDRARRTLAAHLYYRQGFSWSEILDLLNRNNDGSPVTRTQLDVWLSASSTVNSLAFHSLYRNNERLTCHLFKLPQDDFGRLTEVMRLAAAVEPGSSPPGDWSWPEARVIVWRYRDAERHDRILARETCDLNKQELKALCDRCLQQFPFPKIMERLISDFGKWPSARKALTVPGLWQRLVFEYYCKDTTNHQDIHDRTSPAAESAPYSLTMGMLNVWLSNGRLAAKLATYVQSERSLK